MRVLGVMLGRTPHLVVGVKVQERGGTLRRMSSRMVSFWGESGVGAVERGGAVKG